jgi:hypothetical protein
VIFRAVIGTANRFTRIGALKLTLLNLSASELLLQNGNLLHGRLRDARHLDALKERLILSRHNVIIRENVKL